MAIQRFASWIRGLAVVALLFGAAPPSVAQAPEGEWGKALQKLEVGERVIFETAGAPRRTGLLQQMSPEGLSVMVDGQIVQVRRDEVDRLWKHGDPKWTGFALGAGVAAAIISVALIDWCTDSVGTCSTDYAVGAAIVYPGIGGLVGLGIDALIVGKTSVYRRPRNVAFAPMLTPQRAGVQAHVTW
jgi:hypothetical protein